MRIIKTFRFICVIVLLMTGTSASAYDFTVDGIFYDIVSFDDLTCAVVAGDEKYAGDVVVPGTVTYNNRTLTVTSISSYAFYGCSKLTSITIPNTVTSIRYSTFYGCSSLTSITIPNTVTSIGESAFSGCSNLTSITIPNTVTSIEKFAFDGCSRLEKLTIEDGTETLEMGYCYYNSNYAVGCGLFYSCPLKTLYLGRNLSYETRSYYGYSPFYKKATLTEVTIGNTVRLIEDNLFYDCSELTSITIPNSVTSIGNYAFYGCSGLTSITIPNSVTSIGAVVFSGCSSLTSITIPNSVTSIGKCAFQGCSRLTSITIPNSVTLIEDNLFYGCSGLTSITIPNSVTSIGKCAFQGCSRLTSISIPNSVTSIENNAFSGCSRIKKLIIEDGTKTLYLGYNAEKDGLFYSCPLKTLYLGRDLSYETGYSYGYSPFNEKSTLTEVTIGNTVTSIGDYAFSGCSKLTTLYSLNPIPPTVGNDNFTNSHYLNLNVYVPQGSLAAYQSADVWKNFWNLQEFVPSGVETIKADGKNATDTYYDIQGRRLNEPKNGLNIINGKKVLIRK